MTISTSSRRPWRRSAIAIAASAIVLALPGFDGAYAQSNAAGTVYGSVQPGANISIVIENVGTGLRRTVTPDSTGRFNATALPPGMYRATMTRDGRTETSSQFEVLLGQGAEVVFPSSPMSVVVTGRIGRLDTSTSNNGATFTSRQLDALPITRSVDAIIQLAPGTTRADPRYSGGASMGGGAPSENSYYINGFPVTNPLNQLGASELPFGAIGQAQILTGGFGAEFGRSIGGVVNITTKSGSNSWEGGVGLTYSPSSLRSKYKDLFYANTGTGTNNSTDGTLYQRNNDREVTQYTLGGYIGGPIVQDKLFFFTAVERLTTDDARSNLTVPGFNAVPQNRAGWAKRHNTTDRYLGKLDWSITRDHMLELTLIGDKYTQDESLYGYNYVTGVMDGIKSQGATFVNQPDHNQGVGAASQILRYTGYITPDLTITALYGRSKSPHQNTYEGVDVFSSTRQMSAATANRFPGLTYATQYGFGAGTTVLGPGSQDETEAGRIDLEWTLGAHTLRGGVDTVKLKSKSAGEVYAGGGIHVYQRSTNPSLRPQSATQTLAQGNALSTTIAGTTYYYYGYEQVFSTITDAQSNQSAFYLEDKWQIGKDLLITPGLRVEQYENVNGDGQAFLKVKTQIHPRFSFAWDVLGDKSTKLFGSIGRYGVQIPTHLAVRGASRSTFTRQAYTYQNVDPLTGAPVGRLNIGEPYSANNEYGQAKDYRTVAAVDIKPNSQDELTLGIERSLTERFNVGARFTYRKLVATVDDGCDQRPFDTYAANNGITPSPDWHYNCASFNPGQSNTFLVDYGMNGNYTRVNLSAADLGFPKAKRTYMALDLHAEHPLADGWYGKVTYTWSKSRGNTEGQTLSDVAQTDVAATQTWDFPELMDGANGYLPNDRRHQVKAYGFVRVLPEVDVGAVFLAASGRPKNCIGNFLGFDNDGNVLPGSGTPAFGSSAEDFDSYYTYGSSYRRCSFDNGQTITQTPRGSEGTLPWDIRLDMNVVYSPTWAKGLKLRADVLNVTNRQTVQAISEVHEANYDPSTTVGTYGRVISYTPPRSVKFQVTYDVKF